MSTEAIQQQINAHREKEARLKEEWSVIRSNALVECRKIVQAFDFTAAELGLQPITKHSAHMMRIHGEPKFKNPKGPQTWTGRGKRPRWYIEAIDSGIAKEAMLIEKP